MKDTRGVTIVELLVAVVILGTLSGLIAVQFRPDRIALSQSARILSSQVARARFEALKFNGASQLNLSTNGSGSYTLFVDSDRDGTFEIGEEAAVFTFGQGNLARVKLTATSIPNGTVNFDRRGVPMAGNAGTITLSNLDGSATRTLTVTQQGRVTVQ